MVMLAHRRIAHNSPATGVLCHHVYLVMHSRAFFLSYGQPLVSSRFTSGVKSRAISAEQMLPCGSVAGSSTHSRCCPAAADVALRQRCRQQHMQGGLRGGS